MIRWKKPKVRISTWSKKASIIAPGCAIINWIEDIKITGETREIRLLKDIYIKLSMSEVGLFLIHHTFVDFCEYVLKLVVFDFLPLFYPKTMSWAQKKIFLLFGNEKKCWFFQTKWDLTLAWMRMNFLHLFFKNTNSTRGMICVHNNICAAILKRIFLYL